MPEIDPVDWNVEEFRRLLDEPLRLATDPVSYDETSSDAVELASAEVESVKEESAETRHSNSDDHRLHLLPDCDTLPQTNAGDDEALSPIASEYETCGNPSTINLHSQVEPSVESESASPQADEGYLLENARPVLVVNIEMALAARVDTLNELMPPDRPERTNAQPLLIDVESLAVVRERSGSIKENSQEVRAPLENAGRDACPDELSMSGDVPGSCLPTSEKAHLLPSVTSDTIRGSESGQASLGAHIAVGVEAEPDLALPEAREAFQVLISVLNLETKSVVRADTASQHFDLPEIYPSEPVLAVPASSYAGWSISAETAGVIEGDRRSADSIAGSDFPSSLEAGDVRKLVSPVSRSRTLSRPSDSSIEEEFTEEPTMPVPRTGGLSAIEAGETSTLNMCSEGETAKTVIQEPPVPEAISLPSTKSGPASLAMKAVDAMPVFGQSHPVRVDYNIRGVGTTQPLGADDRSGATDLTRPPESFLHKAVFETGVWTAPADRECGIVLRWALRDIRAKRLGLFPLDQHILQMLLDMSLVERSDGQLILTQAGSAAIAST